MTLLQPVANASSARADASSDAATRAALLDRIRAIAPNFAERAAAAEKARRLPAESVREMLVAGIARILMPKRFGGYCLDYEAWLDVVLEISRADCSHAWCASLIIHHAHLLAQFPEACQQEIWADGPDVAVAASFAPRTKAVPVEGGYRLSGQNAAFSSGVDNAKWVMVGALVDRGAGPEPVILLVAPGDFSVRDTWNTAAMSGSGSNTIVTDNAFVPGHRMLALADMRIGTGPGAAIHAEPIYRMPYAFYSALCFSAPVLGAAQGAYARFREGAKTRKAVDDSPVAEKVSLQVGMARAAAQLDSAEMLLRRAARVTDIPRTDANGILARSIRDYAYAGEVAVSAIDALVAQGGTSVFSSAEPIQRAWRDIHFGASHIGLNTELNYGHFGRIELGLPPNPRFVPAGHNLGTP